MTMTREEMQRLASQGRYGDTMLAHINPQEAKMLKKAGGAGTVNPNTGLPEFFSLNQFGGFPQVPLEPLPSLGQALAPEAVQNIAPKLETVTTPATSLGGLRFTQASEQVAPEYSQYVDRSPALGMGGGRQVQGYTIPVEQTFAGKPLVAQYDASGNFKQLTLQPGEYLTPDPSQPNIASVPKINAQGQIVDYGISDLSKQDNGSFGSFIRDVATDLGPMIQAALAYYMPTITNSLAPSLSAAGITDALTQKAVSNAIASSIVDVAQGKDIGTALQNAVVTAATSSGSPQIAQQVNNLVGNSAVTDAILSAGSSAAKTALAGGSNSDITKSIVGGIVGSGVASATGSGVAGSAAAGGVTGGVSGALQNAIASGVGQVGAQQAAADKATKTATDTQSTETKVSNIIGNELANVGIAGALPAADTGAYARALENSNQTLIRLVKEAANDVNYLQKLPELENALIKSGTSISKVLGTGLSLGTYSTELMPNEQEELARRLKDAKLEITLSPLPLTDPNLGRVPLAPGIDLTKPQPELTPEELPTPTPSPETSPIDKPLADLITQPVTRPSVAPSAQPRTATEIVPRTPITTGEPFTPSIIAGQDTSKSTKKTSPSVQPPSTQPYSPTAPVSVSPVTPTTKLPPEELPYIDSGETPVQEGEDSFYKRELPPVEDKTGKPVPYDPKIITTTKVTPKTPLTKILQPAFYGTRGGLTSFRGAGEIEDPSTGKPRRDVWNEASLRLKDALGL